MTFDALDDFAGPGGSSVTTEGALMRMADQSEPNPPRAEAVTTEERAELRRLAEAATPGPWEAVVLGSEGYDVRAPGVPWKPGAKATRRPRVARCDYEEWDVDRANAEYVAAANPVVVVELLETIARVEDLLDEWDRLSKGETPTTARIRAAINPPHAEAVGTSKEAR